MCRSFDFACACIVVLMHVFVPYLSTRAQGGGLNIVEGSIITIADSHIHDNTAVSVVLAYLACIVVLMHVFVPPAGKGQRGFDGKQNWGQRRAGGEALRVSAAEGVDTR